MKKAFFALAVALLSLPAVSAAAPGSFDAFYSQPGGIGLLGWVFIIVSAIAIGVLICYSGGSASAAAPAWVKAVGTWIGSTVYGLHGAAATNAGLALLGGGSVAAGGLGIKGGVALLAILASTGTDIAVTYSIDEATSYFSNKDFVEDSKKMTTFPLPINEEGSSAYEKCFEWIKGEKKKLFDDKEVEFNIHDPQFQRILKEATVIFGRDMLGTKDQDEKANNLTFLALLHFQGGRYRQAFKYASDALLFERRGHGAASLAHCIYATSYLYSESANENIRVQKEHLVPALLKEGSNKLTPFALTIYLDRLMYRIHSGASRPEELLFAIDVLNEKAFSESATKCIPILTVRVLQELKRSQKDVEILTKCNNIAFLRNNKVSSVLDIRCQTFVGLRKVLERLLPFIRLHEKDFDKNYPFTSANIEKQLAGFNSLEPKLRESIAETKRRIALPEQPQEGKQDAQEGTSDNQKDESHWWNPFSWF